MGVACDFCNASEGHYELCPMTHVLSDQNRKIALDLGVTVSTSDWIDAWAKAAKVRLEPNERETLTALFSLHHNSVERATDRRVRAELAKEGVYGDT